MVRRGQQRKRDQRRADSARDSELTTHHGYYEPPPREECTAREMYLPFDDEDTLRIDARTWADSRQIVDFSLMALRFEVDGTEWRWKELARIDICHGHAHAHLLIDMKNDEPIHIARIDSVEDVHRAYRESVGVLQKLARTLISEKEHRHA